jgi:hypothetical protein
MEQSQILITEDAFLVYDTPTNAGLQDSAGFIDIKAEDLYKIDYAPELPEETLEDGLIELPPAPTLLQSEPEK